MQAQPLIAVSDVEASSRWYQNVLGCKSGHGGPDYEQLMFEGHMILQLHRWDAHHHPHIGKPDVAIGNGALLWFWTDEFDDAVDRIVASKATVLEEPHENRNAQHREVWLRDPEGYVVVIAGPYGDVGM